MMSRRDQEQAMIDLSRYTAEMKREALTTIVPHPDEKEARMDLITALRGRRPNLYKMLKGLVHEYGLKEMSAGRNPDLSKIDAVSFLRSHAPSLDVLRAKQVVEIAKSESVNPQKSILDVLKGRSK